MATSSQKIRYDIEAAVSGEGDVAALARQLESLADTLEGDLKTQAQASAQALRELGAKQGAIDNFVQLKNEAGAAAAKLTEAQSAAQKLGQSMAASGAPTRAQTGQLEKLRDAVRSAKTEVQEKTRALDNSRATLRAYGVASDGVAKAELTTRQAIAAARGEVAKLAPAYTAAGNAAAAAADKAKAAKASFSGIGDTLRTIQSIALTAVGGTFLTSMARDVGAVADQYNNLRARLSLVAGEGPALESAFEAVRQVALETSSDLEATVTLFGRISQAGKELGISQQQALQLTQTIGQAIQVSGGSAESANAAIVQLVQGLQSGVLRGEEFNSIMEQAPRLARALADGLGVTTGKLREMSKEGRLTSEVVLNALQGQASAVAAEFEKLPPTIGRALQNLSTQWTTYVGEVDKATGASTTAAQAIQAVGENLDEIAGIATRAGAVLVAVMAVQAAGAIKAYITQAVAAKTATSLLALEMSKLPKTVQISLAFVGFEAGYQFGDMLRENSQLARELGVEFVNWAQKQVNSLQFIKEAAAAVFTDDTIGEALDRYNERAAQQQTIIAQMLVDAAKAPEAVAGAAQKAAEFIASIGAEAEIASRKVRITAQDITEAFQANATAKLGDAQAGEANLRVQLQLAQQSEDMARFMGNEYKVREAKILQMQIEIQLVQARANVARVEAEGSIAVANAKLAEMKASGDVNLVKQAEIENSIKLAQAKIAEAEATGKSTELMQKQLDAFRRASASGAGYGNTLDDLTRRQRGFAGATRDATRAMEEQAAAAANGKYSSPLGADKYSAPAGGSTTGNTREERLAGQNAVDNTLLFEIRDKLRAGTLTGADAPAIRAAMAALDQNAQIDRDVDRMNPGGFSLEGMADRREWAAIRTQLAQTLEKTSVGRRVTVELKNGSQTDTVNTDEQGAAALLRSLKTAALASGR